MRRTTNAEILNLAHRLQSRAATPVLFLGAGCALSAGLPSEGELIAQIGQELRREIGSLQELAEILKSQIDLRLRISQQLSAPKDTAAFEKLAHFIAKGYFQTILTTNWDFLIETNISRFLPPADYKVYVRGEISDEKIADALKQRHPAVKVVKLHGDLLSLPVIDPALLMRFERPLEEQLANTIEANGVVIAGYGLKEPRFHKLLRNNVRPLLVDPEARSEGELKQLGGGATQIAGPDGRFEIFISSLCGLLLAQGYRAWIKDSKEAYGDESVVSITVTDRKNVDETIDRIQESFKASNVTQERVRQLAKTMLTSIRGTFHDEIHKRGICLVFIRDPSAPGGTEIERLVRDDGELNKHASGMDMAWVEMSNRISHKGPRSVSRWGQYSNTKDLNRLAEYGAVVLIDAVAFSGNTLEVAREYLSDGSGRPKQEFTAAVLLLPPETLTRLREGEDRWWEVITPGHGYTGFEVTFPWGWTTATRHVKPLRLEDPSRTEDHFIPRDEFSYTPKPWGDQLSYCVDERVSVSLLIFHRGQRTSTHYHLLRDETFIVLDNRLRVCIWDHYLELRKHESIRIPAGVPHSLIALDQPVRVLEIATGYYDIENDIVRLVDIYSRKTRPDGSDDGLE